MPFVSVIVPNYNHARYLSKRLDSIFNQSFDNFEIIILDDASSDDSKDVISKYMHEDKVSHVVFNETNSGSAFKQWQKGIDLAKGQWIWIAESDDWCDDRLLENLVKNTELDANCVISFCQSNYCEEDKEVLQNMAFHTDSVSKTHWLSSYLNNGAVEIRKYLLYKNTIPNASAVLFKKITYHNVDKSFIKMKMCGDWLLWIQLLKKGNIAFCAESLNNFRTHNSTTRVLDSLEKRRTRLEEEYQIVTDIKDEFGFFSIDIAHRLNDILAEYNKCFIDNWHLLFPYLYKGKIPYLDFLKFKMRKILAYNYK